MDPFGVCYHSAGGNFKAGFCSVSCQLAGFPHREEAAGEKFQTGISKYVGGVYYCDGPDRIFAFKATGYEHFRDRRAHGGRDVFFGGNPD
jgi:hypothetical protein